EEKDAMDMPYFENLKEVHFHNVVGDEREVPEWMYDFLKCTPNLEVFHYVYNGYNESSLFEALSKCTKLKKIYMIGYDGSTPMENGITDDDFVKMLKSLKQLENLTLYYCSYLSGKCFEQIGDLAPNLKTLMIDKQVFNGEIVDDEKEIKL